MIAVYPEFVFLCRQLLFRSENIPNVTRNFRSIFGFCSGLQLCRRLRKGEMSEKIYRDIGVI